MALPSGMSTCAMCVEIMTGTSWVDVSDNMTVVDPPTQTRKTGEINVFGEAAPFITTGKLDSVDVTVRGVWAEGTADPFYTIYAVHTTDCGGLVAVQWSPAGCTTGNESFSTHTTNTELISLQFPAGDASSGDAILYEFAVKSPNITRAVRS